MAEEIAFETGWISNFEGLVTLTLTLDRVILHTFVYTYMPTFIEIEETFCGRTYGLTGGHLRPALLLICDVAYSVRLTFGKITYAYRRAYVSKN